MKLLSIETSCDETAISVIHAEGGYADARFRVLGDALYSQAAMHAEFGGVYPSLAKREHARNLVPLLCGALQTAGLFSYRDEPAAVEAASLLSLRELFSRE